MSQLVLITQEQFDSILSKLDSIESKISDSHSPSEEKAWLTTKEAMKLLNIGQTTLWSYRNQGLITASKINKKLYFSKADILHLLKSKQP